MLKNRIGLAICFLFLLEASVIVQPTPCFARATVSSFQADQIVRLIRKTRRTGSRSIAETYQELGDALTALNQHYAAIQVYLDAEKLARSDFKARNREMVLARSEAGLERAVSSFLEQLEESFYPLEVHTKQGKLRIDRIKNGRVQGKERTPYRFYWNEDEILDSDSVFGRFTLSARSRSGEPWVEVSRSSKVQFLPSKIVLIDEDKIQMCQSLLSRLPPRYIASFLGRLERYMFTAAMDSDQPRKLFDFLEEYPDSQFYGEVQEKLDELAFQDVERDGSESRIREYLSSFPAGAYRGQANAKLDDLQFSKAKSRSDFEEYLRRFPSGRNTEKARRQIEEIAFKSASGRGDLDSYQDFLKEFPASRYTKKVRTAIEKIHAEAERARERAAYKSAQRSGTKESLEDFLRTYPQSKYRKRIKRQLDEVIGEEELRVARSEDTVAGYQKFLRIRRPADLRLEGKVRLLFALIRSGEAEYKQYDEFFQICEEWRCRSRLDSFRISFERLRSYSARTKSVRGALLLFDVSNSESAIHLAMKLVDNSEKEALLVKRFPGLFFQVVGDTSTGSRHSRNSRLRELSFQDPVYYLQTSVVRRIRSTARFGVYTLRFRMSFNVNYEKNFVGLLYSLMPRDQREKRWTEKAEAVAAVSLRPGWEANANFNFPQFVEGRESGLGDFGEYRTSADIDVNSFRVEILSVELN